MKRAIVLSGGGSKGAYQIGVWKALRKLHIKYDIITGTSVGALNAALMTQNKYYKALLFWHNVSFDDVVDLDMSNKDTKSVYKEYFKSAIKGGMTIKRLEKTIDEVLDVNKVYNSKIDMGIVTAQYKPLKPLFLTKKQIKPNKLKDYLVASASCFPAFTKKEIDNINYIDGGLFDNLPINLAIDMGATEVIAVDLKEIGMKQKVKNKDVKITYISPNNDIGSFLIFSKDMARRAIRLGYNDSMKKFNHLEGNKYTFKKNSLNKNYEKYSSRYILEFNKMFDNKNKLSKILGITVLNKINNKEDIKDEFIKIMEFLGNTLGIDDSYIYNYKKYNHLLMNKFKQLKLDPDVKKTIKENKLKMVFSNKMLIKYLYDELENEKTLKYVSIFPKEFLGALYLKVIENNY